MKRFTLVVALVLFLAGCGGSHKPPPTPGSVHAPEQNYSIKKSEQECPQAADGHGTMGGCAPHRVGLAAPKSAQAVGVSGGPTYVDLSNNDPCYCGSSIRAAGHAGLIVKMNQGTGFIDSTAVGMIASGRHAGLAVGGYDFDEDYSISEARVFVSRLKAAGIGPHSTNTFPAIFDVEFGSFSLNGLRLQIAYTESQGYRVAVYTGEWYWTPHAGCTWVGRPAWLAGYPTAPRPCGMAPFYFKDHQYTEHGYVGAGQFGDVSIHFAGTASFNAYVRRNVPKPKPLTPKQKRAKLAELNRLLGAYNRRHNPHGHNCQHPPYPHAYPSARFNHACGVWAGEVRKLRH